MDILSKLAATLRGKMFNRLPAFSDLSQMSRQQADAALWPYKRDLLALLDDDGFTYSPPGRAYHRGLTKRKLARIADFERRLGIAA